MSEKKVRPKKCIGCGFYEKDKVSDDGDHVEGWGCCCPTKCPKATGE